jgi:hypothetical protein
MGGVSGILVLLKVANSNTHPIWIVLELTESSITWIAEQPSNLARIVAVIYSHAPNIDLLSTTDGAQAPLCIKHGFILIHSEAVLALQVPPSAVE